MKYRINPEKAPNRQSNYLEKLEDLLEKVRKSPGKMHFTDNNNFLMYPTEIEEMEFLLGVHLCELAFFVYGTLHINVEL